MFPTGSIPGSEILDDRLDPICSLLGNLGYGAFWFVGKNNATTRTSGDGHCLDGLIHTVHA